MPNGDYSLTRADWQKIRGFFQELSPALCSFAGERNLVIDKYYHDGPAWTFRFRHPKGGGGGIHVERVNDSTIQVRTIWYIDEYRTFTHFLKSEVSADLPLATIDLREVLEEKLKEMTAWTRNDMTAYPGYEKFWSQYSEEEFFEMSGLDRLPDPKL